MGCISTKWVLIRKIGFDFGKMVLVGKNGFFQGKARWVMFLIVMIENAFRENSKGSTAKKKSFHEV